MIEPQEEIDESTIIVVYFDIPHRISAPLCQKWTSTWGAWVAQLVEHLTLDLGSDPDLTVGEFTCRVGLCSDGVEPAGDCVSPSLCPSLPVLSLSLSLSR